MFWAADLLLGQHEGLKGQSGHAEEEIPDAFTWDVRGEGEAILRRRGQKIGRCSLAELPPDMADTAQYSALISSDSLMASCSAWYSSSGDWAETQVALKGLTYLSLLIYRSPAFEMLIDCSNLCDFREISPTLRSFLVPTRKSKTLEGSFSFMVSSSHCLHTHTLLTIMAVVTQGGGCDYLVCASESMLLRSNTTMMATKQQSWWWEQAAFKCLSRHGCFLTLCSSVVCRSNALEALLTCCVPPEWRQIWAVADGPSQDTHTQRGNTLVLYLI